MKISEKSNVRILEKWLKFPSNHSDQRNRSLNFFTPAFLVDLNVQNLCLWKGMLVSSLKTEAATCFRKAFFVYHLYKNSYLKKCNP